MRPRDLAPRILAVVLSACLILPPRAYALRPQQREAEPQLTGLEEALRFGDPDALIQVASSRLAQWIAPAPAAVPGLPVEGSSAVPMGRVRAGLEEPLDDLAAQEPASVILMDLDETASWNRDDPVPSRTPALMRLFLQVTRQAPLDDQERAEVGFLSTRDPENIRQRGQVPGIVQGLPPEDAERLVIYDNSGANAPEVRPLIGDRAKLYLNPNPHPYADDPQKLHPLLAAVHQVTGIGSWTVLPADASKASGNPNHTIYDFGGLGVFLPNPNAPPGTIAKISYWPAVSYHTDGKKLDKTAAEAKRNALFPKLQAATWLDGSQILPAGEISLVIAGSTTVNVEVVGKADLIREQYLSDPSFADRRLVVLDDEGRKYTAGYGVFEINDKRLTAVAVDQDTGKSSGVRGLIKQGRQNLILATGRQMANAAERVLEIEIAKRLAMLELGGWDRVAGAIAGRPQGQTAAQALFLIAKERDPRFGLREMVVEPQLYLPAAAPLYPASADPAQAAIQAERQEAARQIEEVDRLQPDQFQAAGELLDRFVEQSVIGSLVPDHVVPEWGIDERSAFKALTLDVEEPGSFLFLVEDRVEAEVDAVLWALLARMGHRVVIAAKSAPVPGKADVSAVEQIVQAHPALREFQQAGRIEVIETGSRSAGTPLDLASEPLKREFNRLDLRAVIARGPENFGTTVVRNALTAPVVLLYRSEGKALSELTGLDTDQPRWVVAVVPAGERVLRMVPGQPGPLQGTLKELVQSEQQLEQAARASQNYRTLVQIFGSEQEALRRVRGWMRQGRLPFRQAVLGQLHEAVLSRFLQSDPLDFVRRQREMERAEAILWGGGSAIGTNMQVASFHMPGRAWGRVLGVTNNTDNGGRTAWIWDALLEPLGNTVTVGDSSAGWKGQFPQPVQERLLEPDQSWTWEDPKFWDGTTARKTQVSPPSTPVLATFRARVEWLLANFVRQNAGRDAASPEFIRLAVELMNVAELADRNFLQSGLLPVAGPYRREVFLNKNSIRHMVFTTLQMAAGAYDPATKAIRKDRYEVGDYLWQSAFGLPGRVLPSTLDAVELFAKTTDDQGRVVWSSTETFDVPKQAVSNKTETVKDRGQRAISLNPPQAHPGGMIRYGTFGFIDRIAAGREKYVPLDPEIAPGLAADIQNARYGAPSILGPSSTVVSLSAIFSPQVVQALDARPDLAGAYLVNLTRNTETNGWNMMDYVRFIEQVTGRPFERIARYLVVNTRQPNPFAVQGARRLAEQANSPKKPDYQTVLDVWLRHYLSVISVSREKRVEPAQLKEALEWGVNPVGKPATLTPEQQRAVEAAQDLAQRASAPDTLDYPAAMSWFNQFETIGQAVEEINGRMDEGFNELVIALGFADHGESVNTYKQRGGVPPLTETEIAQLNVRGITVIEGDLIRTIGEKYTPGEGRVKVPGVYHDLRVLGFIYHEIEEKHRAWLAGGRQGLPFGGGVFHIDKEHPETASYVRNPSATGLKESIPVEQLAADWSTRSSVALDVRVHRLDMANKEAFAARTNQVPHSYLVYDLLHPKTGQVVASMMVGFSPADVSPNDAVLADVTMNQKLGGTAIDVQFLRWIVQNTLDPSITSLRHRHWEDPEDRDWAIRLSRSEQARQELVNLGRVPWETEPEDIPQYGIRMERASSATWKTGNLPEEDVWFRGQSFPLAPLTATASSPVLTGLEEEGQTRTLLRSDVSGPVVMDVKGVPETVFRHRISVSESIPAEVSGSRLLLTQEGVLPSAVTAQFAARGWKVETFPAEVTPERLAGQVQAGLREWTGSMLVVAATGLEEAVGLLPVEARLTTVFIDPAMASSMAPNVLLAYLPQTLETAPGGVRRLESVTQAGVEEFEAIASQL